MLIATAMLLSTASNIACSERKFASVRWLLHKAVGNAAQPASPTAHRNATPLENAVKQARPTLRRDRQINAATTNPRKAPKMNSRPMMYKAIALVMNMLRTPVTGYNAKLSKSRGLGKLRLEFNFDPLLCLQVGGPVDGGVQTLRVLEGTIAGDQHRTEAGSVRSDQEIQTGESLALRRHPGSHPPIGASNL